MPATEAAVRPRDEAQVAARAHRPHLRRQEEIVVFDGLTYRYPGSEAPALRGVDLRIRRGEYVGVIGPTGAGKSTLCLAFNGIVPQFHGGGVAGSATVAGLDALETPTNRLARHVGMVLEDPEMQITATTVEAEVAFGLENQATPPPEIRRRVSEALAAVGLGGLERKHPAHLSGGQKQRLAIASAIALSPDILVLDEPTAQLDPVAAAEVFAILERLNRDGGTTVVVASHASEELAEHASRILLLSEGRIVADGRPEDIFARTADLARHRVRPPDITQAFESLARRWPNEAPRRLPVTLDQAREALAPLAPRLQALAWPPVASAPAPNAEPALSAEALVHVYPDGTRALDGVDLALGRGSFTAIVGRNGSGKSTLVRHFLRLVEPTSGRVRVGREDVASLRVAQLARRIGFVAQNAHHQIFCGTVKEEVGYALRLQKRPDAEAATARALEAMDLAAMAESHPLSLSRGDRLRVVIAAVLALEPELLIFDEPTTGQDWHGALAILDILGALHRQGRTVVMITHHLYLLPGYAERLVVMNGGRVRRDGPLAEVLYDAEAMADAALVPPQTVRIAQEVQALRAHRLLGAADLERALASGVAA